MTVKHRKIQLNQVACQKFRSMGSTIISDLVQLDKKIVVLTGATGFFGSWLLALFETLNTAGVDIQVFAVSRNPEIFLEAETQYKESRWLTWIRCDLEKDGSALKAIKKCDYILHAATDTASLGSSNQSLALWQIIEMWRSIISAEKTLGNPKILLISSGAVYGKLTENGAQDDQPWLISHDDSRSAYAIGKRFCEESAVLETMYNSSRITIARCFSFFGPGLPLGKSYAIGNFIRDIISGQEIHIKGNGSAIRSYMHVADLCIWLLNLLIKGQIGEAYNVGSETPISMAQLAELVKQISTSDVQIRVDGAPTSSLAPSIYFPLTPKASALGLKITQTLMQGLREMANYAATSEQTTSHV